MTDENGGGPMGTGSLQSALEKQISAIAAEDRRYGGALKARLRSIDLEAGDLERDLLEQGEAPDEARSAVARLRAEQASEVLLGLYAERERFNREAERLHGTARRVTDETVANYERMTLAFYRGQFEKIREDLHQNHRWSTGLEDMSKNLYRSGRETVVKLNALWTETTGNGKKEVAKLNDAARPLLEALFAEHLSPGVIERFFASLQESLDNSARQHWENALEETLHGLVASSARADGRLHSGFADLPTAELDEASKMALFGLSAALTSTAVLAAGWHTLAWSLSGLLLPLLPVLAIATVATAVTRKGKALEKLRGLVDTQEKRLAQTVQRADVYRLRHDVQQASQKTAKRLEREVFHRAVGAFEPSKLDALLRGLEDTLDQLSAESAPTSNEPMEKTPSLPWLDRARTALSGGDDLAAAMYGCLAFEQLLRDISRRLDIGFDFRVPHHNRAFLERLKERNAIPGDSLALLRSLKGRRDMYTHRMHQVAVLPEGRRRKMIGRFLEDLGKIARTGDRRP
jgi:hypothetical protein